MKIEGLYHEFLSKLKKEEILSIVDNFHKLCAIYNYPIALEITKNKKEDLVNYLVDKENVYVKFIIQSLDYKDHKLLEKSLKKKKLDDSLQKYIQEQYLLFNECLPTDIYNNLKKVIKSKKIKKMVKKNDEYYKIAQGLVIAYGVLDYEFFASFVKEKIDLCNLYYKKNYRIENHKVIANELKNKKKINEYFKNKALKQFSCTDLKKLGKNIYHHRDKNYQKLVKTLKSNYIFQNKDIKFLDNKIIIPYLYNNRAMEEEALKNLNKNIDYYFEFANKKLEDKLISKIVDLKKNFPLWECRGYSVLEEESI